VFSFGEFLNNLGMKEEITNEICATVKWQCRRNLSIMALLTIFFSILSVVAFCGLFFSLRYCSDQSAWNIFWAVCSFLSTMFFGWSFEMRKRSIKVEKEI
jgi:RsiW-degrading membrane proteinase PrsW (M82 family)